MRLLPLLFVFLCLFPTQARADQPIFDEMPRWNDGWGVQVLHEYRRETALLDGRKAIRGAFSEDIFLLHIEGVYTWTKAYRVTLKAPVVLQASRTQFDDQGERVTQMDSGLGDPTITFPLKSYFNLDGRSGSFTFAPQIRIPTASRKGYEVFDRVLGNGLSLGYETETYRYHFGASAAGWVYYDAREPAEAAFNLSVGLNIHLLGGSGHLKWKTTAFYENDGSFTLSAGPTLYWKLTDTFHGQLQWKHDFFDHQGRLDHGEGDSFRVGVGVVF